MTTPFKRLAAAYARICYRVDRRCAQEQKRSRDNARVARFLLTGRGLPDVSVGVPRETTMSGAGGA